MSTFQLAANTAAVALAVVLLAIAVGWPPAVVAPVHTAAITVGLADPDTLGWLDGSELTDADRARVALLSGQGQSSDLGVIRGIQAGVRSGVTRRDFELLRQDRRRARAAYPDTREGDLVTGTWLAVDLSARVPDGFCTSGNSNGTRVDGRWYLDGGCLVSVVRPQFTRRAGAAETKRVLAELRSGRRQRTLTHLRRWGYETWVGGTGGSMEVECFPDPLPSNQEAGYVARPGQCVVVLSKTVYTFPFDPADWVDPPHSDEDLRRLALARGATPAKYDPPPERPWVRRDGLLARGQSCPPGRLCWSQWSTEKDDYDNEDIGPDTPEAWVLEQPFGLAYLPAPDNGERRSVPGRPWMLVATYYGSAPQASGGWGEDECRGEMPKLQTGFRLGMQGQDPEELNRGNLKEVRCTQADPPAGALLLRDRALPVPPALPTKVAACVQGGTLAPGQSCEVR